MACPGRCDVARHLLLTVVTSPLRATTPSAPLGRAESLFARARVCTRAAHLLRAQTAANQHSAQHRPAPRDPTFHPPKTPTPPTANSAALSHLAHPHALHPAHPRSAHTTRTPRSPRASRTALPGPCAAHTAAAVSHFRGSHTAQPHRPPPLPEVQHGRRPAKPAPITPLHPLPPAHTAAPAPHTHSGAHLAVGRASHSDALPLRGSLPRRPLAARVRQGPTTPGLARHSVGLHPGRPGERLGERPRRPRRSSRAAAASARHPQRSRAALNRQRPPPRCGAAADGLPDTTRSGGPGGGGRRV